jgi:hypothetical protein
MEKFCPSCGMPMNNNPQPVATIKNSSKSAKYCSCTYEVGQFNQTEVTFRENQSSSIEKMKEEGMPRFLEWLSARGISRL